VLRARHGVAAANRGFFKSRTISRSFPSTRPRRAKRSRHSIVTAKASTRRRGSTSPIAPPTRSPRPRIPRCYSKETISRIPTSRQGSDSSRQGIRDRMSGRPHALRTLARNGPARKTRRNVIRFRSIYGRY
jgi:hypothetical protein